MVSGLLRRIVCGLLCQIRTEQNRTEPNRTEPDRTEPNRTEPESLDVEERTEIDRHTDREQHMLQRMPSTCVIMSGSSGNIFNASDLFKFQCASRSLLRQVYVRCVLGTCRCVFFGVVFSSVLGGSKTVLEPNLGRFWSHVGAILEHFWVLSWLLNSRPFQDAILIDF